MKQGLLGENMSDLKPRYNHVILLKSLPIIIQSKLSSKEKVERFLKTRQYMTDPLIPTPKHEGGQLPMEEAMWYILFDSKGGNDIDTVTRYFWVNAPIINMTFNDIFLVSEKLKNRFFLKIYNSADIIKSTPERAHTIGKAKEFAYEFTGTYQKGYKLKFKDFATNIEGDVFYKPHPKGVLFYNNGKRGVTPTFNIWYYDIFLCDLEGTVTIDGTTYDVSQGKGIIEHAGGIFDTRKVKNWEWLNIQLPEGAIHAFLTTMTFDEKGLVDIDEGAAVINNEFIHFLGGDMKLEPTKYKFNDLFQKETPVEWNFTAESKTGHKIELSLKSTATLSFHGAVDREPVSEFVLDVSGTINGKTVKGKGTLEIITR